MARNEISISEEVLRMIAKPPIERIKKSKNEHINGSGIVRCFHDLEINFAQVLLDEVTELYETGYEPEEIGPLLNRDPDEIFLGLFHQARQGKLDRPFARR